MQQKINKENIVLLPAEKSSIAYVKGKLYTGTVPMYEKTLLSDDVQPVLMYITDKNALIQESDNSWILDTRSMCIAKNTDNHIKSFNEAIVKIIASNNPALSEITSISNEFIQQWIESTNSGKEFKVMMEMEEKSKYKAGKHDNPDVGDEIVYWTIPKLSNNQLILSIVEEKQGISEEDYDAIMSMPSLGLHEEIYWDKQMKAEQQVLQQKESNYDHVEICQMGSGDIMLSQDEGQIDIANGRLNEFIQLLSKFIHKTQ